jgi:hypothetical protein
MRDQASDNLPSLDTGFWLTPCLMIAKRRRARRASMSEFLPDYLIREQAAVGALFTFGIARVIASAVAFERHWRIGRVDRCFIAVAALYCMPQLFELLLQVANSYTALAELEGKAAGCAIALFCAPILGHRLGYE